MLTAPLEFNALSGPARLFDEFLRRAPVGGAERPESIEQQAAALLYKEVKAGHGLAAACKFMEFLRRQSIMDSDGTPPMDVDQLFTLVQRVAESPDEKKADTLRLIEGLLPRQQ